MAPSDASLDPSWRWVDVDGSERSTTLRELTHSVHEEQLPPFVLVWRPGWMEWLPAYLVPELADTLGVEVPHTPDEDDTQREPPSPPLEWYTECLGHGGLPTLLARSRSVRKRRVNLDWSDVFTSEESPTEPRKRRLLPVGAFPDIDAYLDHLRKLRGVRSR
ncbi:MAG: hypothetical protein R3B13_05840 [Polyangiaceae bacterium]